ncbi:hypothetical protein [Rhodopila globiformis]|uniref:Uncharacterized protein n=1 Tax=Rhodopila globiformis TaxID=1071 RepID=A0A2S6NA93_RHOGL|nr:hypothetical protein [Rhodopila globiformis]PPQ31540.1 hypothetical protein CCS01_17285 [Rhodopila globiformis]
MCSQRPADFFSLYARGDLTADTIDDWIDTWHGGLDPRAKDSPLHTYLGLSPEEYALWVYDSDALPTILSARTTGRLLAELVRERLSQLQADHRPFDLTTVRGLQIWLDSHSETQPMTASVR